MTAVTICPAILPHINSRTLPLELGTSLKTLTLKAASILTEPVCKVREYRYTFAILDQLCSTTCQKVCKAFCLTLGIGVYALLSPLALGAIALRGLVAICSSEPYIYLKMAASGKTIPHNHQISIWTHNACYMPGGYSITDGQILPPSYTENMDAKIEQIQASDPDLVCLCEVPDIRDASRLSSRLTAYPFILEVPGLKAIGPSSMLYVASKYKLTNIAFTAFAKGTELTGRAAASEMGFLSFDLQGTNLSVIHTHLQPSEIPSQPARHEIQSRAAQIDRIARHILHKQSQGFKIFFTGDFNQPESDLNASLAKNGLQLHRDLTLVGRPTWGGEKWGAELMNKPPSNPQVLDYALTDPTTRISTQILDTGFSKDEFRRSALSDHFPLLTTLTLDL